MMKQIAVLILWVGLLMPVMAQNSFISDKLVKKWETPAQLKVPESVLFDNQRLIIYVSNIDGSPSAKDGNGFISKISVDGKIITRVWVEGLNGPKGLGISGNFLYVADITRVAIININSGKITDFIEVPGSHFLNDIATDAKGNVYVSDSDDGAVYLIKDHRCKLLVKNDQVKHANGLHVIGDNLLAGLQDRIVSINLASLEVKDFVLNTGGIDGLVPDGQGNYLISDWQGHVNLVSPNREKVLLLDTMPDKSNAADIDYIPSMKLLLVPTFSHNTIAAYEMK
jgi:DNA-binding beta-propeller fold protein YncE